MEDKFYAVIDTNVIVSAVISKSLESNPAKIIRAIVQDRIVPLFNDEDSYLVTGNIKHFPVKPFVVTPTEMVKMMEL